MRWECGNSWTCGRFRARAVIRSSTATRWLRRCPSTGFGIATGLALGGFASAAGVAERGLGQRGVPGYADHMADPDFASALARLGAARASRHDRDVRRGPVVAVSPAADRRRAHGPRLAHPAPRLGSAPVEHELTSFAVRGADFSLTYPPAQGELWA